VTPPGVTTAVTGESAMGAAAAAPVGGPLKRTVVNAGWLLSGKGVGGLLSIVYLALATRSLGVAGFGEFMLVLTYAQAIAYLVQFQSWQTVIRYGAVHVAERRGDRLRSLLAFTVALDLGGAFVGAAVAAAGAWLLGPLLEWTPPEQERAAMFGAALLLLSLRATPTGILRLFGRFATATAAETALPLMRLVGALVAWRSGTGITGFLLAWAFAEAACNAGMWLAAGRTLRSETPDGANWRSASLRGVTADNPGLWRFAWATNASTTINAVWQQAGTLAVGAALGAAAAGGYRLAFQIAQALSKPSASLARAIYPELARLGAGAGGSATDFVRQATVAASLVGAAVVAVGLVGGEFILGVIGGEPFRDAYGYLVLLTIATAIELAGFALEPALLARGRAVSALVARLTAALIYLASLIPLLHLAQGYGAAAASILGAVLSAVFLSWALRRSGSAHIVR
jgi:O-antigen/teichoic acid export membrane protein